MILSLGLNELHHICAKYIHCFNSWFRC